MLKICIQNATELYILWLQQAKPEDRRQPGKEEEESGRFFLP